MDSCNSPWLPDHSKVQLMAAAPILAGWLSGEKTFFLLLDLRVSGSDKRWLDLSVVVWGHISSLSIISSSDVCLTEEV